MICNKLKEVTLILFRMGFWGLLTDGRAKKPNLRSQRICHTSYNDETWHNYTLPKEDPKII